MSMDVAEIAGRLSAAEKDALCGRYSFASPQDEEDGEIALIEAGLWNELFGLRGAERVTLLGLAVRAHLINQDTDHD